jgi:hypothetical protein
MAVKRHPSCRLAQGFLHGRVCFLLDGVSFDEGAASAFRSLIGLDDCVKRLKCGGDSTDMRSYEQCGRMVKKKRNQYLENQRRWDVWLKLMKWRGTQTMSLGS